MSTRIVALLSALVALLVPASSFAQDLVVIKPNSALHRAHAAKNPATKTPNALTSARVLEDRGDWLRVELNAGSRWEDRCAHEPWEFGFVTVHAWVASTELHEVTTAFVTTTHEDGTSVTVSPGVPIVRKKAGTFARIDKYDWPVDPSANQLGTRFRPNPLKYGNGESRLAKGDLTVGGRKIKGTDGEWFTVNRVIEQDGTTRTRIASRCVHATVAGKLVPPEDGVGGLGLLGALRGQGEDYWDIRQGANATWPEGEPAGRFKQHASLLAKKAAEVDGRVCGDFGENGTKLRVCFAKADGTLRRAQPDDGGGIGISGAFGPAPTELPVSPPIVQRMLRQRSRELLACRDRLPAAERAEIGVLALEFEVLPSGHVQNAVASSDAAPDEVLLCVQKTVAALVFPARKTPTAVTHRLDFKDVE